MEMIRYVDLETARAARGLRLAVAGALPSPWTEAAKGLFHVKRIPALAVRFTRGNNDALRAWTGAHNVPVVLHDDEPPRTSWTDILDLAERLGGETSLVPSEPELRLRLHTLVHHLASEGGLGWNSRLIMIHGSLSSGGARSWPVPVAEYLGGKYGYAPDRIAPARARIGEMLALLDQQLAGSRAAGHRYLLGEHLTAADIYLATFLTPLAGLSEADCPGMLPQVRPAFAYLTEELGKQVPPALLGHRVFIYQTHLPWPIPL